MPGLAKTAPHRTVDGGEFRGRGGNDLVDGVYPDPVPAGVILYGLFIGGKGSDLGNVYSGGEYRGGADDDDGGIIGGAHLQGQRGNDPLLAGLGGKFHGGFGTDDVVTCFGTTLVSVESGSC